MKNRILSLILLLSLVLVPTASAASDDEPCTLSQIQKSVVTFTVSGMTKDIPELITIITNLKAHVGTERDRSRLLDRVADTQMSWWTDVVPEFPDCAEANNLVTSVGPWLDEFTIVMFIVQTDKTDLLEGRAQRLGTLTAQVSTDIQTWIKTFDPRTATPKPQSS